MKNFFVLLLLINFLVYGQDVKKPEIRVYGKFLSDTLRLGEPVAYGLGVYYPSDKHFYLPDSTFSFGKFEFRSRDFEPTRSLNGISHDSVVYWLSSFEIDSLQFLSVPALMIEHGDTLFYASNQDSIWFKEYVHQVPDSVTANNLPLKINTVYERVAQLTNYPLLWLVLAIILMALLVSWFLFGNRIKTFFELIRLKRQFKTFIDAYSNIVEEIRNDFSQKKAEEALMLWKKYLEGLYGIPYTRLTSKEISALPENQIVSAPLHVVDRFVYGGKNPGGVDAFFDLKGFSETSYYAKVEALKKPAAIK
ncbi:MAG: hypothetical protein FJZ78_03275 [Bacteroidetes bacterium]|nr:hypothetical protein [Bacteroidota bacterium]